MQRSTSVYYEIQRGRDGVQVSGKHDTPLTVRLHQFVLKIFIHERMIEKPGFQGMGKKKGILVKHNSS